MDSTPMLPGDGLLGLSDVCWPAGERGDAFTAAPPRSTDASDHAGVDVLAREGESADLLVAVAWLQRDPLPPCADLLRTDSGSATTLESSSAAVRFRVGAALDDLPPQFAWVDPASHFALWIQVAALAELRGVPDVALLLLNTLIAHYPKEQGGLTHEVREALALCWARRGRVQRLAGQLNEAAHCYAEARRLSRGAWRDAAPHAELGMSVLAVQRGNFAEASRHARRVLARRPAAATMYQIQAHQILAFTKRRTGALLDALLHAWTAFDLLTREDIRRLELMSTMGEIAAEYGDWEAAARAFRTAAAPHAPPRIRIPALVGALDVARRRGIIATAPGDADERLHMNASARGETGASDARGVTSSSWYGGAWMALERALSPDISINDRVMADIALANGALDMGAFAEASRRVEEARTLAAQHGLHEKQFRADALAARIATGPGADVTAQRDVVERAEPRGDGNVPRRARHRVLQTLRTLAVTAGAP